MEDGVFPHFRSMGDGGELEEERRLAYVGITRARERLYLTHAWSRSLWGSTSYNPPSRFLSEIPSDLLKMKEASESEGRRGPAGGPAPIQVAAGGTVGRGKRGGGVVGGGPGRGRAAPGHRAS